jgi:pimeloyl-ACP methyl ester carboxylesterase
VVPLFVPGWGAPPALYRVPEGWTVLEPPSFAAASTLEQRVRWLCGEIDRRRGDVVLAGHSLGAALAVLAAERRGERVARLVLISPAGLPLTKPVRASVRDFGRQLRTRLYPSGEAMRAIGAVAASPRAAWRLAGEVRSLDLSDRLRALEVPAEVIGCAGDTLTPVAHCRRIAALARAHYREVDVPGGHMWMLGDPVAFAAALQ